MRFPMRAGTVATVLGVDVGPDLVASWARWLAPDVEPFLVGPDDDWTSCGDEGGTITPELRDTFRFWAVPKDSRILWLSEAGFGALPKSLRGALVREQVVRRRGAVPTVRRWSDTLDGSVLRAQADGHRFVWWPSLVVADRLANLSRVISADRLPSRHGEEVTSTLRRCA